MSESELEQVCEKLSFAMVRAMQQSRSVSDSEHYDHHLWVTVHIEKEKQRTEFYNALLSHVVKWGSVSVLTAIFYAMWLALKSELRR
jgi:hypothetical protein